MFPLRQLLDEVLPYWLASAQSHHPAQKLALRCHCPAFLENWDTGGVTFLVHIKIGCNTTQCPLLVDTWFINESLMEAVICPQLAPSHLCMMNSAGLLVSSTKGVGSGPPRGAATNWIVKESIFYLANYLFSFNEFCLCCGYFIASASWLFQKICKFFQIFVKFLGNYR